MVVILALILQYIEETSSIFMSLVADLEYYTTITAIVALILS